MRTPPRLPAARLHLRSLAILLSFSAAAFGSVPDAGLEERLKQIEAKLDAVVAENTALRAQLGVVEKAATPSAKPTLSVASPIRISGDIRTRYEGTFYEAPGVASRDTLVYRLRTGLVATLAPDIEAGFRINGGNIQANYGGSPLSTQFTAGDNAAKKFAFIDQLYLRWKPQLGADTKAALTFGKHENPFFVPSLILFDGDYTPEGFSQELSWKAAPDHTLTFAAGQYMLDELSASTHDPLLLGARARWDAKWNSRWSTAAGLTLVGVTNPEQLTAANIPNNNRGNTRTNTGTLVHDYYPIYGEFSLTRLLASMPGYEGACPVSFISDFMHNPGAADHNNAYSLGLALGKATQPGQWEIVYRFVRIESDAWFEEFIDGDFQGYYTRSPLGWNNNASDTAASPGPGTNVRSHVIKFAYVLRPYLTLASGLFLNRLDRPFPADGAHHAQRFQIDAIVKF